MFGQHVVEEAKLIVEPDHFVAEVMGGGRHQQVVELLVEHQRAGFARDHLLRVVVLAEHRKGHGEIDDVDH
ncbi:hypothetical protein D3C73_1336850 [compost metagenome]